MNHATGNVIWVVQGHGKTVFEKFFKQLTPAQQARIQLVSVTELSGSMMLGWMPGGRQRRILLLNRKPCLGVLKKMFPKRIQPLPKSKNTKIALSSYIQDSLSNVAKSFIPTSTIHPSTLLHHQHFPTIFDAPKGVRHCDLRPHDLYVRTALCSPKFFSASPIQP